jgi:hypothetical protein
MAIDHLTPQVAGLFPMEAIFLPERLGAGLADVSDGHPSTDDPVGRFRDALSSHPAVRTVTERPVPMAVVRNWLTTSLGLEVGHVGDE